MRLCDVDIAGYEGLIFATAARYTPLLDDDLEDVQQILRIKVARALLSFDPAKSRLGEQSYVFSCLRNQVKDLLKSQDRRNGARGGSLGYIEDVPAVSRERYEAKRLSVTADEVYAEVEDECEPLPSTLTELEVAVVQLLVMDFSATEIARQLAVTRRRVAAATAEIQEKMRDWRPTVQLEVRTKVAA